MNELENQPSEKLTRDGEDELKKREQAHPLFAGLRERLETKVVGRLTEVLTPVESARVFVREGRTFLNIEQFPQLPLAGWSLDTPEKAALFLENFALRITDVQKLEDLGKATILLVPPAWGRTGTFAPFEFSDSLGRHFFDLALKGIGETKAVRGDTAFYEWARKRGVEPGGENAGDAIRDWENTERLNRSGVRVPLGVAILDIDQEEALENEDKRKVICLRAFREALRCSDFLYVPQWRNKILNYTVAKIGRAEVMEVNDSPSYLRFFAEKLGKQAALMQNDRYVHGNLLWWREDDPNHLTDRVQTNNVSLAAEIVDHDTGRFFKPSEFENPEKQKKVYERFFTQYYSLLADALFMGKIVSEFDNRVPQAEEIEEIFFSAFVANCKQEDLLVMKTLFETFGPEVEVKTQDDAHGSVKIPRSVELWHGN